MRIRTGLFLLAFLLVLDGAALKIRSKRVVLDMTALRPASDVAIIL